MPPRDRVRILHMIDACEQAISFADDRTHDDLVDDMLFRFAMIHAVLIVLEAASQVSAATRAETPQIAWAPMIGMRNRVVHAYFDIDLDTIWSTVHEDFPPLLTALRQLTAE